MRVLSWGPLGLLPLLLAQTLQLSAQQVDRRFAIDPDASIRIMTPAGSLRVVGWDRDTVQITGVVPRASSLFAGGSGAAGKMGVEPFTETADSRRVTLEVRVPRAARVWVKTISAEVLVSGLIGEVDLVGVTSPLTVIGSPGVLTAETMDGRIRVEGTGGWGVVRVRTGSGPIDLVGAEPGASSAGGDVTATSVGGAITVSLDRVARARLESVSGAVTFRGSLQPTGALEMESHGGHVLVEFRGAVDAEFELSAVNGRIVNRIAKMTPDAGLGGAPVRFVTGKGTGQVTIRTFKGTITIGN